MNGSFRPFTGYLQSFAVVFPDELGEPDGALCGLEAYPSGFGNKKPARTLSVLAGLFRYFGYALGGPGKPYANRP